MRLGRCYGIDRPAVKHSVAPLRFTGRPTPKWQGKDFYHAHCASYLAAERNRQHVAHADLVMSPLDTAAVEPHVAFLDQCAGQRPGLGEA